MEEKATFAAGCFWGVEDRFMKLPGVLKTRVGYTGGTVKKPTYEMVCGGGTGHKEAVEVVFDPGQLSYEKLLHAFWEMHDPTTANRQGLDVGEQYHSVIFYHTDEQKDAAEKSKQSLQELGVYKSPIMTDVVPAGEFHEAEGYHQKYVQKHGAGSCPA
ncbi:MAG: peptide-methionine (S)-S-oxide reductase MsrA [Candidatus Kaiserbacteria bacterium]|nr:peptide-methionine (S)-S-oxide reductase MsrA [Candidatus Kaiserbacteria bacterium]